MVENVTANGTVKSYFRVHFENHTFVFRSGFLFTGYSEGPNFFRKMAYLYTNYVGKI